MHAVANGVLCASKCVFFYVCGLYILVYVCTEAVYIFMFVRRVYVVGSKSFRPDIKKPRQMENAVRDI